MSYCLVLYLDGTFQRYSYWPNLHIAIGACTIASVWIVKPKTFIPAY